MRAKPLLPGQPVTATGQAGSQELMEVIQRLVAALSEANAQIAALDARVTALEP